MSAIKPDIYWCYECGKFLPAKHDRNPTWKAIILLKADKIVRRIEDMTTNRIHGWIESARSAPRELEEIIIRQNRDNYDNKHKKNVSEVS
jgi:hypothetical protein